VAASGVTRIVMLRVVVWSARPGTKYSCSATTTPQLPTSHGTEAGQCTASQHCFLGSESVLQHGTLQLTLGVHQAMHLEEHKELEH